MPVPACWNFAVNQNREPWPGSLSTPTRPPIISMSCFEIARPRPVPPYLRVMEPSTCTKGWNRRVSRTSNKSAMFCSGVFCSEASPTLTRADGAGVLRCTRRDGSVTWQKQEKHAAHFAPHDLTHYAVETALGYRRGFFGLFDAERASGVLWTADEFNSAAPRVLTEAEIRRVRAPRAKLFEDWFTVQPGEKLAITFPA